VPDASGKIARKAKARHERDQLRGRLEREGFPELAKKLAGCGVQIPYTCTHCGNVHQAETKCMARWCPGCAPLVSAERLARWAHAIAKLENPLFLTLTLPNSEDPQTLRRLKDCWGKLRRRKVFREKVLGGVATYEVTNKGQGWHPHLHAVMDCEWLAIHTPKPEQWQPKEHRKELCARAKEEFTAIWRHIIDEPTAITWISRVHSAGIAKEILKYAAKGSDLIRSPQPVGPMLQVLRKTRTLAGWGSMFPLPSPDEEQKPLVECSKCGQTKTLLPSELVYRIAEIDSDFTAGRTVQPNRQQRP
jgi:hypothetical protein